jgi:cyanophycinase
MSQPATQPFRLLPLALAVTLASALALPGQAAEPGVGAVVAIGGGSEQPALIKEVLDLAKGTQSRVAILNTASSEPAKSGPAYQRFFSALGVQHAAVVPLLERDQAYEPAVLDALGRADLIYVTGGNQIKLAQTLVDTPAHGAILAAWQRGAVVAGTSAGAMVWGPQYLAAGESKTALTGLGEPRQQLELRAGLGLLPRVVVDTHFTREGRMGRLMVAAGRSPGQIGLGVDERTAAVIAPSGVRVLGEGRVAVFDYSQAVRPEKPGAMFSVRGVQLHLLGSGDALRWRRDDTERRPMLPPRPQADASMLALWLQGGPLPLALGPQADAATMFGRRPAEVLILVGDQAQPMAQRWQTTLQAGGVTRTPVLSAAEISRGALGPAIARAEAVLLIDDARWTLGRSLSGDPARLLRQHASKLVMGGAGAAVAIPGDTTIQAGGGEVVPGLRLASGLIPAADWMAEGAFDRLVLDALLSGGALGLGLSPDNGARVAGGAISAQGGSPVLVLQTDKVSLANPNVPTARDLLLHVVAPGETLKL